MTITLAANQLPPGTRPGSPIDVVDVKSFNGANEYTTGLTVPAQAQGGDIVWAQWAVTLSTTSYSAGLSTSPGGFFTIPGGNLATDAGPPQSMVIYNPLYRVCSGTPGQSSPDAGRTVGLSWNSSLNQFAWALIVWTLRYVDNVTIFDVAGGGGTSGTTPSANGVTGQVTTVTNGAMAIGAIAAYGGVARTGLAISPLPQWYNRVDAVNTVQPNIGLTSGIADLPVAGTYLGITACAFQSGSPLANVSADWVGSLVAFRPVPAPAAPPIYLNPAGGALDAADIAGRPLTVYWNYVPVRGQGPQQSWLLARETGGGTILQYWNADKQAWQTTEFWNYGTRTSYTFPASAWVNDGTQWHVGVAVTESALGLKSGVAVTPNFITLAPPAVTAVTVTNQGTTTPTINWTAALTASPQIAYRVRVFSSDQIALPGFNPTNILADDDSDFELTTGTWVSLNSTVQLGAAHNYTGGGDLFMQANGTGGVSAFTGSYPVKPNVAYRVIGYTWADVTPRAMTLGIIWQDVNGNQISTSNGTPTTDSTTAWTQVTASGTAPASAATARLIISSTVSATNEVHRLDQVRLSANPTPKWDSGVVLGTATSATTAALAASVSYTAYVEVLQTNDQWSPVLPYVNGAYVNSPTATWFAGLSTPPLPPPGVLTATVGGTA